MQRFLVGLCLLAMVTPAAASTWELDPAHSGVQFAITHLMVSTVRGTFNKFSGTVNLDENDPTKSSVEATIDVASVDTREPKRDEHLRGADYFDVAKYPTITFKSTAISKAGGGKYRVQGDLTMHGVTKSVALLVSGSPTPLKDPFGNTKMGGVVNGVLNRKDFGMTWNKTLDSGGVVLGDEVTITIDVELVKK